MSNTIINRLEKLFHGSSSMGEKENDEGASDVATCTKERISQPKPSGLITGNNPIENWAGGNDAIDNGSNLTLDSNHPHKTVSLKELIATRIAQTEHGDGTQANRTLSISKNDKNRTLINIDSLAASIYFWSPYAARDKEEVKFKFMPGKLKGTLKGQMMRVFNDASGNNYARRNKDTFINFSEPALVMVAKNPETPTSTLKWLAAHRSTEVRQAVAENQSTDDATLILLAEDPDENVKSSLLDNTRVTKDIAAKLARTKSFALSTKARNIYYQLDIKSKEASLNKTTDGKNDNPKQIMQNERAFLKALAVSADDSKRILVKSPRLKADWHIRMLVAGDPNATAEILWQLATNPISEVKRKLVDKYNCLLETVVNLKGHKTHDAKDILVASETQTIN